MSDRVISCGGVGSGDGVVAGGGGSACGGAQVQTADYRAGITVEEGPVAGGKCGVGCAIDLGFIVGGDGQSCLVHGQDAGGVADLVVISGGVGGGDGVGSGGGG